MCVTLAVSVTGDVSVAFDVSETLVVPIIRNKLVTLAVPRTFNVSVILVVLVTHEIQYQ